MAPLQRVRPEEVSARSPLPFTVLDGDGRRLFEAGVVIGSVGYLQLLLGRGLYRESCAEDGPLRAGEPPAAWPG